VNPYIIIESHFKFGGEDMYSPNDNPYTLYQLFMPDYEKNDFYESLPVFFALCSLYILNFSMMVPGKYPIQEFFLDLLAGAILAWIVELFVSIILVWKRLVVTK